MTLNQIRSRLRSMVAFGHVSAPMADGGPNATVQATLTGIENPPAMPMISHFGFSSSPRPGSGLVALFAGGDRSRGVVIGTVDPSSRRTGLQPGEVSVGPSAAIEIHLADGVITIKHPTKVRVETPRLECTGEVVAMCDGPSVTVSQHTHPADSAPPNPHT